jgi:ribosomal protein S18 acetylase RimI-like enzyme
MAPGKVLAYNGSLERHHLRLRTWIGSILFLRGVPLDRIWLRPKWLFPFKGDVSRWPSSHTVFEGRRVEEGRPRVAILSPYFPFPLSHGGAVRIFNLVKEAARDFDVFLFAFAEKPSSAEQTPVLDYVAKAIVFPNPRYREPRWASLRPPEVNEFYCGYVAETVARFRHEYGLSVLQVEYTHMAGYGGEVLVEHDVTYDLLSQIHEREKSLGSWWNLWRQVRFERRVVQQFPRVVAMSDKDAAMLGPDVRTRVIPNGVDLERFRPEREPSGNSLLFVGSFAHFPNVVAFRFFVEEIWPLVLERVPDARFTVIAGRNPDLYWKEPLHDSRIEFHGFISDVRPFYSAANVVVVPTRVSAGTNLKVLEAMAMERAVVSTTSGCAGLGLEHGRSVWIADEAQGFAAAVELLLRNDTLRRTLALDAKRRAEQHYGWPKLGLLQKRMWHELLSGGGTIRVRPGEQADLEAITRIQDQSEGASHWEPDSYFSFDVLVAERNGSVVGFMVSRSIVGSETEVLNLAVAAEARRCGIATALLGTVGDVEVFLEVRESNEPARQLYTKLGFRPVGLREGYYENPAEAAVVMRRPAGKFSK